MFSKLLKHEWRASRGLLGLLSLMALGVGILATVALRVLTSFFEQMMNSDNPLVMMAMISMEMILPMAVLSLFVYAVAVLVLLLFRFYKNKFTDEGYLTFTLPVTPTQIYWSSLVNMLIWRLISIVVVVAAGLMVVLIGTAEYGFINMNVLRGISAVWQGVMNGLKNLKGQELAAVWLYAISGLISLLSGLVIPMACVTMGASLAKKHKILAAFGLYYGVNVVVGILSSVLMFVPTLMLSIQNNTDYIMVVSAAISLLLTAGLTVGGYFTTIGLMKHKLNLA